MRRTVPPSAEIQAEIDKLLAKGMVDDPQKLLGELGRLGARLIIQRAVEDEFDQWLGRARYERRPLRAHPSYHGFAGVSSSELMIPSVTTRAVVPRAEPAKPTV